MIVIKKPIWLASVYGGVFAVCLLGAIPVRAALVAGTGNANEYFKGAAAVYHWDQGEWIKISPDPGIGLGRHSAVYCLYDYHERLYAGTDDGQVYVYAGGTQWLPTGQNGNDIPPEAQLLSFGTCLDRLYAGTRPGGLYVYDETQDTWTKVSVNNYEMLGYVCLYPWTDPDTNREDLYIGDIYHDMILQWDPRKEETARELSIRAPRGSCIWDIQEFQDDLYASSFHGRIYVRCRDPLCSNVLIEGDRWYFATKEHRGYINTLELEVFKNNLYAGSDGVLERVRLDRSTWDRLTFETVYEVDRKLQQTENITAMVSADQLYFGTSYGNIFAYDGENTPELLGSPLPLLYTLADTHFFTQHPQVEQFSKASSHCVVQGNTFSYTIEYKLSGSSAGDVFLIEELPDVLTLMTAEPEPHRIEGQRIFWNLGQTEDETLAGFIRVTVSVVSSLPRGTDLTSQCSLHDENAVFGMLEYPLLYDVSRLYVDANATHSHQDGLSWETAFGALNDALQKASHFGIPDIWLAEGRYNLPEKRSDGSESRQFIIPGFVSLYGGFKGDETELASRSASEHEVILEDMSNSHNNIVVVQTPNTQRSFSSPCPQQTVLDNLNIYGRNSTGSGSGIFAENAPDHPLLLRYCRIENCGQGVFVADDSSLQVEHCKIVGNGVGISLSGTLSETVIQDCYIAENDLGTFLGGGMRAKFIDCDLYRNGQQRAQSDKYCGGVAAFCSHLELLRCRFSENESRLGGALFAGCPNDQTSPYITLRDCCFTANDAPVENAERDDRPIGRGGALALMGGVFDIQDVWFVDNQAKSGGGAVAAFQSEGALARCVFVGNQTVANPQSCGGGMLVEGSRQTVSLYRSVFQENGASYGGGLVTRGNESYPTTIKNCTFKNNRGELWGGGALSIDNKKQNYRTVGGNAEIVNSLFSGNTGQVDGAAFEVYENGILTLHYCATDEPWYKKQYLWVETGEDRKRLGQVRVVSEKSMLVLYESPFIAERDGDYHLALDRTEGPGNKGLFLDDPLAQADLDGDEAPLGGYWDIGADESDPNGVQGACVQVGRLVYRAGNGAQLLIKLLFQEARISGADADRVAFYSVGIREGGPVFEASLNSLEALVIEETGMQEHSTGSGFLAVPSAVFEDGVYTVQLVFGASPSRVKAVSQRFFVRPSISVSTGTQ